MSLQQILSLIACYLSVSVMYGIMLTADFQATTDNGMTKQALLKIMVKAVWWFPRLIFFSTIGLAKRWTNLPDEDSMDKEDDYYL